MNQTDPLRYKLLIWSKKVLENQTGVLNGINEGSYNQMKHCEFKDD